MWVWIHESRKRTRWIKKILDDPKVFFDSLSKDEFSKLLDKYGFEYKEKKEFNWKQCANYNIGEGIDDIRECQDCNYNNK